MTKLWKKIPSERTVFDKMNCDLCNKESKQDDWTKQNYDVAETEVSIKEGTSYPEGGYGTEINIDLCMECFTYILIPFLEKQGVKINKKRWDW